MADGGLGGVLGGSISETRDASLLGGSRDGLAGCRTWLRIGVRLCKVRAANNSTQP